MTTMTRRRVLQIAGTMGVMGGIAGLAGGAAALGRSHTIHVWRGVALGAEAEIRLTVPEPDLAGAIVRACREELARLEAIFSLYRSDSTLARLNRNGAVDAPGSDLLTVLSIAASVHDATGGAFDPTVQPLWQALAEAAVAHGAAKAATASGPVGFDQVVYGPERVAFARPGMALTLNGIAQGYITDRIADLLAARGLTDTLVNIGELRALGGHPDGGAWPVRLAGTSRVHGLTNRALATSSGGGTVLGAAGNGHIIDPLSGVTAPIDRQATVEAPTAALADALSTACCLMTRDAAQSATGSFPQVRLINHG